MTCLHILADDLTGALDCAAAFGAGVPVHLGQPAGLSTVTGTTGMAIDIDIVATATRDVPLADLSGLLSPCLPWLGAADLAFKKVDSLLRGNTFDEVDWLARHAGFAGLAMVPAFPAQGRVTEAGQQWWHTPAGERVAVAASIRQALQARGWSVHCDASPPPWQGQAVAWVPDVCDDAAMDAVAAQAMHQAAPQPSEPGSAATATAAPRWLWCGSAGLAHALARRLPAFQPHFSPPDETALALKNGPAPVLATSSAEAVKAVEGPLLLVSASHHAVTREQWRVLAQSAWGAHRIGVQDLQVGSAQRLASVPACLIDLAAQEVLTPEQAAALLAQQVDLLARHAPRPRTLVVIGGDTLLALCRALGAVSLQSQAPLDRPGWGCARMLGGRWDGVVCHTRSGAFGGPDDVVQVMNSL